ncbi:hypothetical protein VULLAG_LOCUS12436 [Vulpes lagopus]
MVSKVCSGEATTRPSVPCPSRESASLPGACGPDQASQVAASTQAALGARPTVPMRCAGSGRPESRDRAKPGPSLSLAQIAAPSLLLAITHLRVQGLLLLQFTSLHEAEETAQSKTSGQHGLAHLDQGEVLGVAEAPGVKERRAEQPGEIGRGNAKAMNGALD